MENETIKTNFSKKTLTKSAKGLAVIPVTSSKWSDPGSPRRVKSTLSGLNGASFVKSEPIEKFMKL